MGSLVYPIQSIAIIGGIVFIFFMVIFPLIGLKYGWRKALFWGGGNLVLYAAGLVLWTIFADTLCTKLTALLIQYVPQLKEIDPSALMKSILAPILLLLLILFGNLFLLINYAIWGRRAFGIRKEQRANKLFKNRRKELKAEGKEIPAQLTAKLKNGDVVVEKSKGAKAANKVAGLLIMPVAMFPVSASMSSFAYFITSNSVTRANNKFASSIYDFLNKLDTKLHWVSFYKENTGADYNVVLTALPHLNEKVTVNYHDATKIDESTGELAPKEGAQPFTGSILQLISDKLINGITNFQQSLADFKKETFIDIYKPKFEEVYAQKIDEGKTPEEAAEAAMLAAKEAVKPKVQTEANSFNELADVWNVISTQYKDLFSAIMQSTNALDLLKQAVNIINISKVKINSTNIDNIFGKKDSKGVRDEKTGIFKDLVRDYSSESDKPNRIINAKIEVTIEGFEDPLNDEVPFYLIYLKPIEGNDDFKETFSNILTSLFEFDETVTEQADKDLFIEGIKTISNAFVTVKK